MSAKRSQTIGVADLNIFCCFLSPVWEHASLCCDRDILLVMENQLGRRRQKTLPWIQSLNHCSSVMLEDGKLNLDKCFSLCMLCFMTVTVHFFSRLKGSHIRQDSMEPSDLWDDVSNCRCGDRLKTLEQRAKKQHQRCLAHSLVGTPNYIAPEVLLRKGR